MKLNNSVLRHLYISCLKDVVPHTRKDCPSPKELLRLFRTKKSEKNKTRIIDHVTKCIYCANEVEFILKALRYEANMNVVAEKILSIEKEKFPSKSSIRKHFSTQFSWKFASLFAVALGLCLFIAFYALSIKLKNPIYRTTSQSQIRPIQPVKTKISKSLLSFRWESVMSSDYFVLEIFDESLYRIWKSPKIAENNTKLPNEISNLMEENKTYFWMITVFFVNGKVIESPLQEFYLIE